ncbi:Ribosomal RNA-processing protein 7 [Giardia muris]|uniref:Ribosomal RNA-processing protein 7 n=1 Tax=Giardia muris TaxID=5742 RepID=A0A4Z1SUE1_GIAMU|nr:Ribosomal RNA-processing protein 7 [Giardia muris]|eukprot:TNJ29330.1 Ribosomal RNA-processing protein 7 [Giardia muris]
MNTDLKPIWIRILDLQPIPLFFHITEKRDAAFVANIPFIFGQKDLQVIFEHFAEVSSVQLREFLQRQLQPHWSVGPARAPRYAEITFGSYPEALIEYVETTLFYNGETVSLTPLKSKLHFSSLISMYTQAYEQDTRLPADVLRQVCEIFIGKYDALPQPEAEGVDQDGWQKPQASSVRTTYTRNKRIVGIDEEYTAMKIQQMRDRLLEKNFYTFQRKVQHEVELERLRQKHEEETRHLARFSRKEIGNPFLHNLK